jgi:tripartite ATP-independent transporter DctM subunit
MSLELLTIVYLGLLAISIISGYYMGPAIGGIGLLMGYLILGVDITNELFYSRVYSLLQSYSLLAMPLFVFMGEMLSRTGVIDDLYKALHLLLGKFKGGLTLATVLFGTVLAACLGVITASVSMLTIMGLASMVDRGYSKSFVAGTICASGTLGILIPPSIMFVVYGPLAGISVGKLLVAAILPGLMLSTLYSLYVIIRSHLQPDLAPPVSKEEYDSVSLKDKLKLLAKSVVPPILLILAVLGSIFFGIAPPTEAAAAGAFASVIISIIYKKFTLTALKESSRDTMRIISFSFLIATLAYGGIGIFMRMGGHNVINEFILSIGGKWISFSVILGMAFILGMFMDWLPILFIMIPIITPAVSKLGFDPLWFGMIFCISLQIGLMTPPFAVAIFVCKGTADERIGLTVMDIIRGEAPYILIMLISLFIMIAFPEIITWLPSQMMKGWH